MDAKGARALRERLDEAKAVRTAKTAAAVPEDAPAVYHWLGVAPVPADAGPPVSEAAPDASRLSWRRRLGLSVR